MGDLTKFCKPIQQVKSKKVVVESAVCKAILFDENDDGFVSSLDKKNYNNNVDYIEIIENGIILIELKDIQANIFSLFKKKPNTEEIQKKLLSNVENKFTDSLRIIQKNINPNLMPTINYLVVANNTENNLLDKYLPENLKKNLFFVVCKTDEICKKLSTLNTRLCQ